MRQPPRKTRYRILAFVVPGVSLACAFLLVVAYSQTSSKQPTLLEAAHAQNIQDIQRLLEERDADGNGVSDWEEIVATTALEQGGNVSTSPHSASGYAPTTTPLFAQDASLTVTQRVSREMFGTYLSMRRTGTLDENAKQELLGTLIAQAQTFATVPPRTAESLLVVEHPTLEQTQNYATILQAQLASLNELRENELLLVGRLIEESDEDARSELLRAVEVYRQVADGMHAMQVPQPIASAHIGVVEALDAIAYDFEGLAHIDSDPLRSMVVLGRLVDDETSLRTNFAKLGTSLTASSNL